MRSLLRILWIFIAGLWIYHSCFCLASLKLKQLVQSTYLCLRSLVVYSTANHLDKKVQCQLNVFSARILPYNFGQIKILDHLKFHHAHIHFIYYSQLLKGSFKPIKRNAHLIFLSSMCVHLSADCLFVFMFKV